MPSQLIGLMRRLTWNDYPKERDVPLPGPGQAVEAAGTKTDVPDVPVPVRTIPGSAPPRFRIDDNLTVKVVFDPNASWRAIWVKTLPQAEQDRLLRHEQGHYHIAALMGRDFFLDVMPLKAKVYAKVEDAVAEVGTVKNNVLPKIAKVQKFYDDDTEHGSNQAAQDRWNLMINTAFTSPRSPPATAADGVPLKVRLLDVVRGAGITLPP
jgi:hypothetical protein